jgi:hypothetical protein
VLSIEISQAQWEKIYLQLKQQYPPSVIMIRDKMKSTLGFTVRNHRYFDPNSERYKFQLYLDFVDQQSLVFFKLKYFNV